NRDIDIVGTHLADVTSVTVNGMPMVFNVVWDTLIHAWIPAGASTGPIQVTNTSGSATSAANFTATPIITSFGPMPRLPGDAIKIIGEGFDTATDVKFNGVSASFT